MSPLLKRNSVLINSLAVRFPFIKNILEVYPELDEIINESEIDRNIITEYLANDKMGRVRIKMHLDEKRINEYNELVSNSYQIKKSRFDYSLLITESPLLLIEEEIKLVSDVLSAKITFKNYESSSCADLAVFKSQIYYRIPVMHSQLLKRGSETAVNSVIHKYRHHFDFIDIIDPSTFTGRISRKPLYAALIEAKSLQLYLEYLINERNTVEGVKDKSPAEIEKIEKLIKSTLLPKAKNIRQGKTFAFSWKGGVEIEKLQVCLESAGLIDKNVDPKIFSKAFSGEELEAPLKIMWLSSTKKGEPNKINLLYLIYILAQKNLIESTDIPNDFENGADLFNKIRKIFVDKSGNQLENLGESFKLFNKLKRFEILYKKAIDAAIREIDEDKNTAFENDEEFENYKKGIHKKYKENLCKELMVPSHKFDTHLADIAKKKNFLNTILKGLR
jgi:hypothetical protein